MRRYLRAEDHEITVDDEGREWTPDPQADDGWAVASRVQTYEELSSHTNRIHTAIERLRAAGVPWARYSRASTGSVDGVVVPVEAAEQLANLLQTHHPLAWRVLEVLRELAQDPDVLATAYGIDLNDPDPAPLDDVLSVWVRGGCPLLAPQSPDEPHWLALAVLVELQREAAIGPFHLAVFDNDDPGAPDQHLDLNRVVRAWCEADCPTWLQRQVPSDPGTKASEVFQVLMDALAYEGIDAADWLRARVKELV